MINYRTQPPEFFYEEQDHQANYTSIEKLEIYIEDVYKDDILTSMVDEVKQRIQLIAFTNKSIRELENQLSTFGKLTSDERIQLYVKKQLLTKLINEI